MKKDSHNVAIIKWLLPRLIGVLVFLIGLNEVYRHTRWEQDVREFSRVRNRIDSAFNSGADIYLGESSNTSFNPWTDTLNESISDFLQYYFPERKIEAVTHEGYHPGLFRQMLELLPTLPKDSVRTIWLGVNLRTCGPSAIFSGNEASNQREALYYSNRPPLLTRIFMGLHFYDNRNEKERERLKFQWWRTRELNIREVSKAPYNTALNWIDAVAQNYDTGLQEDIKGMMGAYIKEFGFVLDEDNPRLQDLRDIVGICNSKGWRLVYHILPPNRYHAAWLFTQQNPAVRVNDTLKEGDLRYELPPSELGFLIDYNYSFLRRKFFEWGVEVVDNYNLKEAVVENAAKKGSYFTDQWYPTEHYNSVIRLAIAEKLAFQELEGDSSEWVLRKERVRSQLRQNNYHNWDIVMPLSDPERRGYRVRRD